MSIPSFNRMRKSFSLLFSFFFLVFSASVEYKEKTASVFVGKDIGWQVVEEDYGSNSPHPIASDSWKSSNSSLYISIASFRDTLCPYTLFNIYSKSLYPSRIHVGIVQQNAVGDVDCLLSYCKLMEDGKYSKEAGGRCPFEENIRMMRVDSSIAKGPTWGRAKAATLLRDEEFCMQTDAHMDFVPNWDVKMMKMWADTKNEYAVLSTYVADSEQLKYNEAEDAKGLNDNHEVPHLCMVTLDGSNGLVRIWGTKCARGLQRPKLTNAIWGAGLSFSKCHAERKATYDPHTPFIFDGEEFSRAIRFWTWGYDIYTPNKVLVVHNYKVSQSDPNHFDWYRSKPDQTEGSLSDSVFRLKTLLEIPGGARTDKERLALQQSRYGLGDRRTLDQAIQFSGIDTRNHKILGNRCGNIDYVPFKQHPFGVNFIPPYDPINERFLGPRDPNSVYYNASDEGMRRDWENADAQWRRVNQQAELRGLRGKKHGAPAGATESMAGFINSVAHIVHVSSGDGMGIHAQEPDGSLIMVLIVAIIGISFNVFCARRCHAGKVTGLTVADNSLIKTV